jgi:hypothetical protein
MTTRSNAPAGGQGALKIRDSRIYTSNCPTASYQRLCLERFLSSLLDPFACSSCHRVVLDPVGPNDKGQFFRELCAVSRRPKAVCVEVS